MMQYACTMTMLGGLLRSGGADGSDTSVEFGTKAAYDALAAKFGYPEGEYGRVMEIYLGWGGFNGRQASEQQGYWALDNPEAALVAAEIHPAWGKLPSGARSLMQRNTHQVLGRDLLSPSRFVLCWTPDGAKQEGHTSSKTGGTGQAIRLASRRGIPVYNLGDKGDLAFVMDWLDRMDQALQDRIGLSPKAVVEQALIQHKGIRNHQEGDILKLFKEGEVDVLVHGTNCFLRMGTGIAKRIRESYPVVYSDYTALKRGDKALLGTIQPVEVDRPCGKGWVVNAFTQYGYSRDPEVLSADYEAIRKAFRAIAKQFPKGARIGIPRIGSTNANGCWVTISNIIQNELKDHNLVLIDLPSNERSMDDDLEVDDLSEENSGPQMGLF